MKKLFFIGVIIFVALACQQEDDETPTSSTTEPDYLPMAIGNYWVYQVFKIDTLGTETEKDWVDSICIANDTMINNKQYYIFETYHNYSEIHRDQILRDSLGYIVDEKGKIYFSVDNDTDTLLRQIEINNEDTLYVASYKMKKNPGFVNVPAGGFETLIYEGTINVIAFVTDVDNPRYLRYHYADGVGKVLSNYFYLSSPDIYEKRLIRYNVLPKE